MNSQFESSLTIETERKAYIAASGRFLAFPIAGAIVWSAVALAGLALPARTALYVLLFGSGAIFPIALGISQLTGQKIMLKGNVLADLMGQCVLMVNLLWPLHFLIVYKAPSLAALSIALGLGLHWIVFGWIIRHPLGLRHTLLRTALCVCAHVFCTGHELSAVATAVVLSYLITLIELLRLPRVPAR